MSGIKEVLCPNCRRKVVWSEEAPFRPFCSKRCQLVDFGDWAAERHRIPAEEPDEFTEDLQDSGSSSRDTDGN
ncbi:MAG: DNA gyrase inhibitor YacG [Pseudohongiellaceae bacterium]